MKKIIGGVIAVAIGGTTFAISQSNIVNKLSENTGLTQQEAQQYVDSIPESNLQSFATIGQDLVSDGKSILNTVSSIDCVQNTYQWETPSLDCADGKEQLQNIGNDEIELGNCYQTLDTNLGDTVKSKISECIKDIDRVDSDYALPITDVLDSETKSDYKNTNAYNKSVLQTALESPLESP